MCVCVYKGLTLKATCVELSHSPHGFLVRNSGVCLAVETAWELSCGISSVTHEHLTVCVSVSHMNISLCTSKCHT